MEASRSSYNLKSPAVKRLMREAKELAAPTFLYFAQPLEDNLFEWHFTIRGPSDTEFEGGIYHGRIILPADYPMKPPSIIMLTANGRFQTHTKICLSISKHHPESWQPSWSIRTALLAIIGFMPTPGMGAIGSLDYDKNDRRKLAHKSVGFKCAVCGNAASLLKSVDEKFSTQEEIKELASHLHMQVQKENPAVNDKSQPENQLGTEPNSDLRQRKPAAASTQHDQIIPQTTSSTTTTIASGSSISTSTTTATSSGTSSTSTTTATSSGTTHTASSSSTTSATTTESRTVTTAQSGRQGSHSDRSSYILDICIALIAVILAILICRRIFLISYVQD